MAAGDPAERKAAAHRLKGSSLAFGAPRMTEICRALERDDEDLPALVAKLKAELASVLAEAPEAEAARVST